MNVTDLKADVDFLCGSTSATYPDADKIRNINIAYQDVARTIWESADGWQYDDSNATTLPIAKANMVHTQQDYSIPSTAQRIQRVEVKDSAGNFKKLKQVDIHDVTIAMGEFNETPGLPVYYDVVGRSLMLYPTPASGSVTLSAGLQLYFDRDIEDFAVSASTETPGFAKPFHRLLSYAASIDFVRDDNEKRVLAEQKKRLSDGLTRFYGKRNVEYKSTIKPAGKKRWRQYL